MGNTLRALLRMPTTRVGIAVAVMFQLIFSVVWMTGYDGVSDNAGNLKVAVVNEDQQLGLTVAKRIGEQMPFAVVEMNSLEEAQQKLDRRDVQMIVHIPAQFSAAVMSPESKGTLDFYINESNPATVKNMMTGAAGGITAAVNRIAVQNGTQAVLTGLNVPAEQAAAMAAGISERVTNEFHYTNPVSSMSKQMVPMMMVLASYVGSMLLAMNVEQSSAAIAGGHSKWKRFAARQIINAAAAIAVSLIGTTLVVLFGGSAAQGFITLWGFQALFLFAFMSTAQIFVLLLGPAGMVFNIILLSAQLVSSGAMVPRELLSDFFYRLGGLFPATYAVEGVMNVLFGGPDVSEPALALLWIILAALGLSVLAVLARKEKHAFASSAAEPAQSSALHAKPTV
ncbi:YhgE/Pip domain-containing protein [Paenibacillus alkalitolerans]|uniref:YhgE/Pip domain-containing protein n=1 Tax=Paenibacillus alkalitolerans TaxID=2799335 RepID=UPI0018F477BD|nr:ABC transporter permease [Paenibacillus alkalitolerans]